MKLSYSCLEEGKIVDILSKVDNILEVEIKKLKQWKKVLLQQMFR